jgi:hypothetical protein
MKMKWTSRAHPISDIRDWKRNDRLEIQPDFQRNVVWTQSAQIALIDTILNNIPFPKIYIQAIVRNENTYRIVIDGQQRITAILEFIENRLRLKQKHLCHGLALHDGKTFQELPEGVRNEILQYNVDFNEISNATDEEVRDMYARVNKYTVQLNKQELRRADYPGELLIVAEELADFPFFEDAKMFSAGQKRRMLDVEFILELLCVILEGEQDKKDSLDGFCDRYAKLPGHFSEQDEAVLNEVIKLFYPSAPDAGDELDDLRGFRTRLAQMSAGSKNTISVFCNVLADIQVIFDKTLPISKTRFKQKSDFYSLFSCIFSFQKDGQKIKTVAIESLRDALRELDRGIEPHSENQDFSDYAIRCISDANSLATRKWRNTFLGKYLAAVYGNTPL